MCGLWRERLSIVDNEMVTAVFQGISDWGRYFKSKQRAFMRGVTWSRELERCLTLDGSCENYLVTRGTWNEYRWRWEWRKGPRMWETWKEACVLLSVGGAWWELKPRGGTQADQTFFTRPLRAVSLTSRYLKQRS